MLKRVTRIFWYTGAALVIVAALLLSAARLVLPMLDDHHDELQAWLTARVGQPVQIERLDLGWHGLGPDLLLINTTLYDESGAKAVLHLDELRIGVNLWQSWRQEQLVTSRIGLFGSKLDLVRREDGRIVLRGKEVITPLDNPIALVLTQPRIELRDVELGWEDRYLGQSRMEFTGVELSLRNHRTRHQLHLAAIPASSLGKVLELQADVVVPQDRPEHWEGKVYMRAEGVLLREWLGRYLSQRWYIGGVMDTRLWADFQAGRIEALQGEMAIDLPVFASQAQAAPLFAGVNLSTYLDWKRVGAAWRLSLDDLKLVQVDRDWPRTGMTLVMDPDMELGRRFQLAVDEVNLDVLTPLVPMLEIDEELKARLAGLAPEGNVTNLQVGARKAAGRWQDVRFKADIDELAWRSWRQIPGMQGVRASLLGAPERGRIELGVQQGGLLAPKLFREPIPVERLAGVLYWDVLADRLRISGSGLELANADIRGKGRVQLDIPGKGSSPFLNMQATFEDGDAASTSRYLPAGIMKDRTLDWLDRAIVSGEVVTGSVLFHGRLDEFPFDQKQGRMEIRAYIRNGILDYHPEWHRIEEIETQLTFINRGMRIEAVSGSVLGARLSDILVTIPDLRHSRLRVEGHAHGPLGDMLRFVQESPLARKGYALGLLEGQGEADLDLRLDMPLRKEEMDQTRIEGRVHLADNAIALRPWEIRFEDVEGRLDFTESGVTAPGLEARLWDAPVEIELARHPVSEALTRISLHGRLPVIEKLADARLAIGDHLSGRSDWQVQLDVGKQEAGYQLVVESGLEGIAIDLPEPLAKPAGEHRQLRVTTHIRQREAGPFYVSLGQHSAALDLDLEHPSPQLRQATVLLNRGPATLPDAPGLVLQGELERLSVDAWRALLNREGSTGLPAVSLHSATLEIEQLELFHQTFDQVDLKVEPALSGWSVSLSGPDIAGTAVVPRSGSQLPVDLDLTHLALHKDEAETDDGERLDPADVPPLDIRIDDFHYGELDLGKVQMKSEPVAYGMEVESLQVEGDWLNLSAQGNWTLRDAREASRFDIEVHGGNLGRMLTAFGYSGNVEGGETHGEINANWPGSPMDFELKNVEGSLELRIGAGQLVKLEPGAGRIFGLLNLHALPRRLTLDFSDLFKRGFAFDRIEGHFTLIDSDAYTQDLVIQGPSAHIDISGRIGLAAQDYDQLVTVTPEVSSGLPIAGALAGGPAVGAALFLADKLLGKQFQDIARYQYAVTGSWEDPDFRRLGREDAADTVNSAQNPGQ